MAQHDYVIANQSGSAFRADLNNALSATVTGNSGSSAPSTTYAYMIWNDTTSNQRKIRNSANNAWIVLSTLSGGNVFDDDVTFNGASYNLVWDKSDNALEFADNAKCTFGAGPDLSIFHDADSSYIEHTTSGTDLIIDAKSPGDDLILRAADDVEIRVQGNEDAIKCKGDGAVELYYDGSKKIETITSGVRISSGDLELLDNTGSTGRLLLGNGADLQLYHTGSASYIKDAGTGDFNIISNTIQFSNAANDEFLARFVENGAVELYYDGSKKIETFGSGATLTGQLYVNFDASQVSGANFKNANNTGTVIYFSRADGTVTGSISQPTTTSTSFNTSSDYRLKENEVAISDGITRLKTLKPYKFNFKVDPDTTVDGFFAHEVTPAVPEAITGEKDAPIDEKGEGYQQIDYGKLVPLLTAALQEAIAKIETLETKVATLEAK